MRVVEVEGCGAGERAYAGGESFSDVVASHILDSRRKFTLYF